MFHFWGKLYDFKEIFLGEVAFIQLQLNNKKPGGAINTILIDGFYFDISIISLTS